MANLVLLTLCIFGSSIILTDAIKTVTNEDIRDAILSVVHMIRTSDDKLERHEYRERNLGEQLKKSILTLEKRLKLLDPVKGTISRLDERLATVETILMQKDERERLQFQKTFDTVEDIQKNLPVIMEKMKQDIIEKISNKVSSSSGPPAASGVSKDDLKELQINLEKRLDKVVSTVEHLEKELTGIREDNKNIKDYNGKSSETLDKVKRQLNESEILLEKYENKLAEMNNKVPQVPQSYYKDQHDWYTKVLQALDVQKSNLEQILSDMKSVSLKVNNLPEKEDFDSARNDTLYHLQKASHPTSSVNSDLVEKKLQNIENVVETHHKDLTSDIAEVEKIVKDISQNLLKNLDDIKDNIKEKALASSPVSSNKDIKEILTNLKEVSDKIMDLPNRDDIETAKKEALSRLERLSFEGGNANNNYNTDMLPMIQDGSFETIDVKLKQMQQDSDVKHRELIQTMKDMSNTTLKLTEGFGNSYLDLKNDLSQLGKFEHEFVKIDDSIRDTKRRVEYGVHQIVLEVGDVMRRYIKEVNSTFNDRFDNFEVDMFGEETGALANFTFKIGNEIDKVWRQIGIMHQQMSSSADTLGVLLNHTDHYVNGSLTLMDGMKGKVGTITEKMVEVDDNLNFLLGKLHLVTQEFNQVRKELGKVLDNIKKSFSKINTKVEDIGPGPHMIDDSEDVAVDTRNNNLK